MKRILALIPLDAYDRVSNPIHTDAVRERAFNHGHGAKGRGNERERAQADLYLSPVPQTSFYVVTHTAEDVLVVGGGTATHHARRLLKTFSGRL